MTKPINSLYYRYQIIVFFIDIKYDNKSLYIAQQKDGFAICDNNGINNKSITITQYDQIALISIVYFGK